MGWINWLINRDQRRNYVWEQNARKELGMSKTEYRLQRQLDKVNEKLEKLKK